MAILVILEGTDSCGKTTLAQEFVKRGFAYLHASGKSFLHEHMQDYHEHIIMQAKMMLANGMNVVIDRLWPSEACYGLELRSDLQHKYSFAKIRELLKPLKPHYVFCLSPSGLARHIHSHQDLDHQYTSEVYKKVFTNYQTLFCDMVNQGNDTFFSYDLEQEGHDMEAFINYVTLI
jgi:thymidylate kinase